MLLRNKLIIGVCVLTLTACTAVVEGYEEGGIIGAGAALVTNYKQTLEKGEDYAAPYLADVADLRCRTRSKVERANLLTEVNAELEKRGSKTRVVSIDCDGDGIPDPLVAE